MGTDYPVMDEKWKNPFGWKILAVVIADEVQNPGHKMRFTTRLLSLRKLMDYSQEQKACVLKRIFLVPTGAEEHLKNSLLFHSIFFLQAIEPASLPFYSYHKVMLPNGKKILYRKNSDC